MKQKGQKKAADGQGPQAKGGKRDEGRDVSSGPGVFKIYQQSAQMSLGRESAL